VGQLTPIGCLESHNLGVRFRNIIPTNIKIDVRSSGKSRALETTQSFLLGLYPDKTPIIMSENKRQKYDELIIPLYYYPVNELYIKGYNYHHLYG
jgi:hypothetical protein